MTLWRSCELVRMDRFSHEGRPIYLEEGLLNGVCGLRAGLFDTTFMSGEFRKVGIIIGHTCHVH